MRARGVIAGMALGAGLVYFLDQEQGAERRRRWRARLEKALESGSVNERLESLAVVDTSIWHYGSRMGDIEGLEAANLVRRRADAEGNDLLLRAAGGALTWFGWSRRGATAAAARAVGAGLLATSKAGGIARQGDRRRTVDIQKTIHISAQVDQVYAFWSNYENFPLFMSHVREVEDLGQGRSHWSVSGPGGVPIEWNASLTEQTPNEVIAWRSEAGSMLENAGVIRFTADGIGTRVDLRFCYLPPAGGAGQAVAELLGSDPRAKLNEDLGRMKALLEATTRSQTHGKESQP
jgi:uncharacterized membrane protein